MPDIDIRPAAAQMAGVLALVPDDALDAPTPVRGHDRSASSSAT